MTNVIIEHKDGRTYSTTREGFHKLYEDEGFKITGEETDLSFVPVGIPKQKRSRPTPRAKTAKAKVAKPEPIVLPEPAVEKV